MSWGALPGQLCRFADVLKRERATKPTAEFIFAGSGHFLSEWKQYCRLSAQRLPIPQPRNQGLHPVGCEIQDSYLSFKFEAARDDERPQLADFQVQVRGLLLVNDILFELQDHWRIDSEGAVQNREGEPTQGLTMGRESHPAFHFQRGGHAQEEFASRDGFVPGAHIGVDGNDWKALMQYPGPRIATLPLDPILAVDFCIAQHDGVLWKRLRNVPEYFNIVKEAQSRLWKPFLEGLSERGGRQEWLGPLVVV